MPFAKVANDQRDVAARIRSAVPRHRDSRRVWWARRRCRRAASAVVTFAVLAGLRAVVPPQGGGEAAGGRRAAALLLIAVIGADVRRWRSFGGGGGVARAGWPGARFVGRCAVALAVGSGDVSGAGGADADLADAWGGGDAPLAGMPARSLLGVVRHARSGQFVQARRRPRRGPAACAHRRTVFDHQRCRRCWWPSSPP